MFCKYVSYSYFFNFAILHVINSLLDKFSDHSSEVPDHGGSGSEQRHGSEVGHGEVEPGTHGGAEEVEQEAEPGILSCQPESDPEESKPEHAEQPENAEHTKAEAESSPGHGGGDAEHPEHEGHEAESETSVHVPGVEHQPFVESP